MAYGLLGFVCCGLMVVALIQRRQWLDVAVRHELIAGFFPVVYFVSKICLVCLCGCFAVTHGLIFVFWVRMGWILDSDGLDFDGVQVGFGLVGLGQHGGQWWWRGGDWVVFAMGFWWVWDFGGQWTVMAWWAWWWRGGGDWVVQFFFNEFAGFFFFF